MFNSDTVQEICQFKCIYSPLETNSALPIWVAGIQYMRNTLFVSYFPLHRLFPFIMIDVPMAWDRQNSSYFHLPFFVRTVS